MWDEVLKEIAVEFKGSRTRFNNCSQSCGTVLEMEEIGEQFLWISDPWISGDQHVRKNSECSET